MPSQTGPCEIGITPALILVSLGSGSFLGLGPSCSGPQGAVRPGLKHDP
jgi:hypothetical protein